MLSILATLVLLAAGSWAWLAHARAWGLGGDAPVLSYDAAQYAVAARELAEHGRLQTRFALPLELSKHASPPWPLALVQPGLVIGEAALFRAASLAGTPTGHAPGARLEWLALVFPVLGYLGTGLVIGLGVAALLARLAPDSTPGRCASAGLVVGFAFLLDPEAQHFATGGFTELPFTLGLCGAVLMIATGAAGRRPLLFGILLGITGAFRGNMLWLAPVLAAGAAVTARERRVSVWARALAGYALPLAPWWIYKWISFGTPGWDLSWVSIWTDIGGRDWFSLNHLPDLPELPHGGAAVSAIAAKVARNIPRLLLELSRGPSALLIGALLVWTARASDSGDSRPRPDVAAARALAGVLAVTLLTAAMSEPLRRYLFPARIVAEAAGLVALWGILRRAPQSLVGPRMASLLAPAIAVLVIVWAAWGTTRGWAEASVAAAGRGVPAPASLIRLAAEVDRAAGANEPVMSNLGPILAWYSRRPIVHLALTPDDLDTCRRRLDVRHVLLVFRDAERAWPGWGPVVERPEEAMHRKEWNISSARRALTADGFTVVWLEMGPLEPRLASLRPATLSGR